MITKQRWVDSLAMSLFQKETTFDGGVTLGSGTACLLTGYDSGPVVWDDKIINEQNIVTGKQIGRAHV